jgi:hypothetical protein
MKNKIYLLALMILCLTSCDDYLDVNTDPNSVSEDDVTSDLVFPGAEMNLCASYGDFLRIAGGYFSQQYAHSFGTSNYIAYSQFTMSASRSSSTYTQLYSRALTNFETVREKASSEDDWGSYLAATVLRAFTFQVLVDMYGETPYSEALDISNLTPVYDEGSVVYYGILDEIDAALDNVSSSDDVCTNYLFETTSVDEWIELANALKLKILMRMSNVEDVEDELSALIAEDNFPSEDVVWDNIWSDESGSANPFYQEEFATYFGSTQVNVVANLAYMQTMVASNDGRISSYWESSVESDEYTGGISGTNFSTSSVYTSDYFCRPAVAYDDPVYLISVSEVEFFLAEYYARYGSETNAETHYIAAIEASFQSAGLDSGDAYDIYTTYYPYDNVNYAECIGVQKWIALGGVNNFEAWCEMRRLDYPEFGTVSGDDIYNEENDDYTPEVYVENTLYTPIDYDTDLGAGLILERFKYAETSTSQNTNAPDNKEPYEPVFWAE